MGSPDGSSLRANISTSPSHLPTPQLPPPPSPSTDAGIAPNKQASHEDHGTLPDPAELDIFTLSPVAALKVLCSSLETLIRITGDIPPTPPVSRPSTSSMDIIGAEEENKAQHAEEETRRKRRPRQWTGDDDVPTNAKTPIGSPEARPTEPLHRLETDEATLYAQQGAVIRKFYSKKPPAIPLEEYLLRLHQYCPMSIAVYLATSLYIYKLAIIEKLLPVTARNAHRLVLAGLRVAMKALEDLTYPHSRFAKVGGVTEPELARLEISFCFVTDFNLRVTSEMLLEHAKVARNSSSLYRLPGGLRLGIPRLKDKRNVVIGQSKPPTALRSEASAVVG
ncbi:MAG: hypothetical protein Q9217_000876 [Psora testacea]